MPASRVVHRASGLLLVLGMLAAGPPGRLAAQERTLPLAPDGYVRVVNRGGSVHVTGWDVDSVRWVAHVGAGQELFGGGSPRMVKVGIAGPDGIASLDVHVPRGAKLVVDAGEATVDVRGLTGPIEVRGGGGAVQVIGAPVRLTIETVDGAVTLSGGPFRSTEVRTAGGSIHASGMREDFVLSTVTGAITAEVAAVTRGRMESVSGVVRFTGDIDPTGTLTVESHGGDVTLALDPGPGFELVATAFGGEIVNTLTRTSPRPVRKGRGIQLETIAGNGGGTITVTAFRGNLRIQPK